MTPYVVAVDIGGTSVKSALVTGDARIVEQRRTPTDRRRVIALVLEEIQTLVGAGLVRFGHRPAAIGVASLGMVDDVTGVAVASGTVGWRDVPLREIIARETGLPVTVTNDLRAAALAEARQGVHDDFLFVAVGTGIGGAAVTGGTVAAGAHQRAGELGHVVVAPHGYECACGSTGCLEAEASATAVARRYRDRTGLDRSAAQVAVAAKAGDPDAVAVWQTTVQRLADGLSAAAAVLDPGAIVVGGGVSLAGDFLLAPLRREFLNRFRLPRPPEVFVSTLGDAAARTGAALLAWKLTSS